MHVLLDGAANNESSIRQGFAKKEKIGSPLTAGEEAKNSRPLRMTVPTISRDCK